MVPKSSIKLVLGTGMIGDRSLDTMATFDTHEEVNGLLDAFLKRGYNEIDTARNYSPGAPGSCEQRLGAVGAGNRFIINTKVKSGQEGAHRKEGIEESVRESIEALDIPQVNINFLHLPDRATPFDETCKAMDAAHRQGKLKQFGLSNFSADEVEKIVEICESRGFVKPTVYQGQYNPIARSGEKDLFPILRKHGIAFYAYSPAAGGFFTGSYKSPGTGSRFDTKHMIGGLYTAMYTKPDIVAASDKAVEVIEKHGINGHAAALRWTAHHSVLDEKHGDAVIIGVSKLSQLDQNIDYFEQGPLPEEVATAMNDLYKKIEGSEIAYHF